MKYINADRLRAEIDKKIVERGKELKSFSDKDYVCREASNVAWRKRGYLDIIELLDSIQQEQPIQVNTLTWRDINDIERIINNVHYEFRNGIGEKSFGEEVLKRFREERDEQEQPEVDLEKIIGQTYHDGSVADTDDMDHIDYENIARYFYELGKKDMKKQMIKESVEVNVIATKCGDKYQQLLITNWNGFNDLLNNDKVRIVVLKKEESK